MLRLFVAFHFDRVGPLEGSASLVLGIRSCHQLESCHQFHPQTTQWDSAVLGYSEFGDAVTEHVIVPCRCKEIKIDFAIDVNDSDRQTDVLDPDPSAASAQGAVTGMTHLDSENGLHLDTAFVGR